MNETESYYPDVPVAERSVASRATFISRTYAHLTAAIFAFTGLEVFYFKSGLAVKMAEAMMGVSWLLVLGAFVIVSWMASRVAFSARGLGAQYAALAGFVVAESIIFVPLLYVAQYKAGGGIIQSAAAVTLIGFTALTIIVFMTRKDFSFLRGILFWGGIMALGAIVGSFIFNYELGTWFSIAMIAVAGGAILYDTSNILHHYPEDRYVGAALALFASVALMFWYVLRLFLSRR